MLKRKITAIKVAALLFLLAALLTTAACGKQIVLKGQVEAPVFSQYAEVAGKIVELPVELGQSVKAGDLIAAIDDSDARYALEQLEAVLTRKKAALAQLEEGADSLEIKQARNNIELAQANYDAKKILYERALADYGKAQDLFSSGAVTQNYLDLAGDQKDLAENNTAAARTQLDNARQSLSLILEGADEQAIIAAEADVSQTESQLEQMQANLAKYRITALSDGVVISKNYLLGDMVSAGYNLADISANGEKYLVAYVPEDDIYNIEYGQSIEITYGGESIRGTVSYIDAKAQYTPKDMQSSANKNKDTIKIKLRLPEDSALNPGEKAQVVIEKKQ